MKQFATVDRCELSSLVPVLFTFLLVLVLSPIHTTPGLKKAAALKMKLDDLFHEKECLLNREALINLTAFGLHNFGGSDEALEMCIAGAWVALFHEIGYEVDAEKFGKGCPSRRTISRYDVHGSCCCLFVC
jgi:hypothetical protein